MQHECVFPTLTLQNLTTPTIKREFVMIHFYVFSKKFLGWTATSSICMEKSEAQLHVFLILVLNIMSGEFNASYETSTNHEVPCYVMFKIATCLKFAGPNISVTTHLKKKTPKLTNQ